MKCGGCDKPMGVDAPVPGRELYVDGWRWCADCGSLTADRPKPNGTRDARISAILQTLLRTRSKEK